MTDEKFTFIEDLRSKKQMAGAARHKRGHCGKGGAVKFPSDFMTKKERDAMNGEMKSYKLNEPMPWAEFKVMPDDIKRTYITTIRKKYNVSDVKIAEMLGCGQSTISKETQRLGIPSVKGGPGRAGGNKDAWYAWVNGVQVEPAEKVAEVKPTLAEVKPTPAEVKPLLTPSSGEMVLTGKVEDAVETIKLLLGGAEVSLTVQWTVLA